MKIITKTEAKWLREQGLGEKVKKAYNHQTYYVVEDYDHKFDRHGNLIKSVPVEALAALYEHREKITTRVN